ncbi:MAG: metallophosphoesterase family protein, partial [Pirellula sp.]
SQSTGEKRLPERVSMRVFLETRRALAALLLVSNLSSIALSHDGHKPTLAKPAEVYRPSLIPDRIILTWKSDPRTTQAVTWRTSTEVDHSIAQIAVANDGPIRIEDALQVEAKTESLKTDLNEANFHSAEFIDLRPATKYAYRVGDGANWSEWFHFTTAPSRHEPFSFVYFGDAQNDIKSLWSRVIREAYGDDPKARFMIHAGDLVNTPESDAEWGEWFYAGSFLHSSVTSVPVPGNHEIAKAADGGRRLTHHWKKQFTLPEHGPSGLEESCYTFEYGNTRIIGLNSNEQQDEQAEWLNRVLAKNESKWIICTFHHPIFSTAKDRDNEALRKSWKPILDTYRVDLVLTGHDHTYGRTGLDTPSSLPQTIGNAPSGENRVDPTTGTVYVVSVSGPKMYALQPSTVMKRVAEDTQLYQIIRIDGDELVYEAKTATGKLYDSFKLRKRIGSINELQEIQPEMEQRTRPKVENKATTEVGSK